MSRRRGEGLTIAPPATVDETPREFFFIVRTGDLDAGSGARLTDGVLTVRATDSLAHQVRAVEQVLRHCRNLPNQMRRADLDEVAR